MDGKHSIRRKTGMTRLVSILLVIFMLLPAMPEILPHAHASEYEAGDIDGKTFVRDYEDGEWGKGKVYTLCGVCGQCYEHDFTDNEWEDAAYDLISDCFPYDSCDCCMLCSEHTHCFNCERCFEQSEVDRCPTCNTNLCLDCHYDWYHCDFCGVCILEEGEDGSIGYQGAAGHGGESLIDGGSASFDCICQWCLEDSIQCSNCNRYVIVAGDFELWSNWCPECILCGECVENAAVLADFGHCVSCGACGNDVDVCGTCNLCEDCNVGKTHCPECDECWEGEIEWCTGGGQHCTNCDTGNEWICPQCEGCTETLGTEICYDCGLCNLCCLENSIGDGCTHGYCVESGDFSDHLCPGCGLCPDDTECEYCLLCADCQEDYHCQHGLCPDDDDYYEHVCDGCGECFDLEELCVLCHLCDDCNEHCEKHGMCPENPDYEDHLCWGCGDCFDEDKLCELCHMCEDCRVHCEKHDMCSEDPDYEDHVCASCGDCFEEGELCEFCHMCEDCREHCDAHDICPEDPEHENHTCASCGDCFDEDEFCEYCHLCLDCCHGETESYGCDHEICVENPDFEDHYCFEHGQCVEYCDHYGCEHENLGSWKYDAERHWQLCLDCGLHVSYSKHVEGEHRTVKVADPLRRVNGVVHVLCRDCGKVLRVETIRYTDIPTDGTPYITSQPKDYIDKVSNIEYGNIPRYATFKVTAGGTGLTYRWYRHTASGDVALTDRIGDEYYYNISGKYEISGAQTKSLTIMVPGDACTETYEYFCVVTNAKGSATTRICKIQAAHDFSVKINNGDGTHSKRCAGCELTKGKPQDHRMSALVTIKPATQTENGMQEQHCLDCNYINYRTLWKTGANHTHDYKYYGSNSAGHWNECSCGRRMYEVVYAHTFGAWTVTKEATEKTTGKREHTCTVCGYTVTETTEKLPHTHDFVTPVNSDLPLFVPPNGGCDSKGHYRRCAGCTSKHYEEHSMGMWHYKKTSYTDPHGNVYPSMLYRSCTECGYTEYEYTDKNWPVIAEPYDSGEGRALGAAIVGPATANAGEKVTLRYTLNEGYVASGYGLGGSAWGVYEVTSSEGLYIGTKWYGYNNGSVNDFKVNSDGSLTFTMPEGPVAILVLTSKCTHAGASTYSDTVLPTCTGYGAHVLRCSICRGVKTELDRIEPAGHNFETVYVDEYGDCEHRDLLDVRCVDCGEEKQIRGDFRHSYVDAENYMEPGCHTIGHESDLVCEDCGRVIHGEKIPAYGTHSFGMIYYLREATPTVKGIIAHDCVRCGFHEQRITDYSGPDYRLTVDKNNYTFSFTYGETPEPLILKFTSVGRDAVTKITDFIDLDGLAKQGWRVKQIGDMSISIAPDPEMLILNGMQNHEFVFTVGAILEGSEFSAPNIKIKTAIKYPKTKKTLTVEDVKIAWWDDVKLTWVEEEGETASIRPGTRVRLTHIQGLTVPVDDWIILDESRMVSSRQYDYSAYCEDEEYFFVMPTSDLTIKAGYTEKITEVALIDVKYPNSGNLAGSFRTVGIPEDSPFTFVRFEWIDSETGEVLSDGTPFACGKGYTGYIYLKPGRGYYFDKNDLPSDVTINGSTSPVHDRSCVVEDSGLYRLQTGRRVTDPGTIRSVYFTVPIPGDGAYALRYPKFITADDDPAIYVTTRWLIYDGSTYSDFTGTFREGDSLYLHLSFRCTDPARHFYTDGSHWLATNVYINGVRRDVKVYGDDIYMDWEIEVGPAEGSLSLSEFLLDYLDVLEPDNAYTHIEAYLTGVDPSYEPELVWRSSDTNIATVEAEDGYTAKVTAVGYGDATVTVMTADGLYSATLPVHNRRPAVRGVEIDRHSVELLYGTDQRVILKATVYPENAANKRVSWRSNDESVARVTSGGEVVPVGRGICWITAVTEDGEYESTCEVTVRDPVEYDLWIDQIRVTEENMGDILYDRLFVFDGDRTLTVNGSYTARYTHALIESSIPGLIIKIEGNVTLTGRQGVMRLSGDTTIKGGTLTVKSDTISPIYVLEGSALTVNGATLNTEGPGGLMGDSEGECLIIDNATVNVNATVPGWAIFDFDGGVTLENVKFRIPENGQFINGTAYDASGSDISALTIGPRISVKGVSISETELAMKPGDTAILTAQITPLDASNRTYEWSTTDRTVARVDGDGIVTAIGIGSALITVRTNDGHYIASCLVTVGCSHVAGEPVREGEIAPDCVTEGEYDEVIYCSLCGEEISREHKTTPALGHDFEEEFTVDVEPTETTPGSKSRHCTRCDAVTDVTVIPPTGGSGEPGDVNGDGELNMKDVLIMRRYIAGLDELTDAQIAAGDFDGDGDITMKDVLRARRIIAGLD